MKPYPSYKNSGVEAVGDIPIGWITSKVRYITDDHRQGYYSSKPYDDNGYRVVRITDVNDDHSISHLNSPFYDLDDEEFDRFRLEVGDFVFPRTGGVGRFGIVHFDTPSIYGSFLIRFRFNDLVGSELLKYFFGSKPYLDQVLKQVHGGVNQNVHVENIKDCFIPVPPLQEQTLISNYLDRKIGPIDSLIEKTKEKIELLKEQRSSLINNVVTTGLNPNVEMKDSGVEWIGDIPSDWGVVSIRRLCSVKRGSSPRPIDDSKYFDEQGEFNWVRIADVSSSVRYLEKTTQTLSELGSDLSTKRFPGDIFLSIAGSVGKPIITKIKCCIHDGFVWFDGLEVNSEYMYYLFLTGQCFQGLGKFGTQLNLNTDTVGSIKIPLITNNEQQRIVEYLDTKTMKIDKLVEKETRRVEHLEEYRQSLISKVVTGKVDVREEVIL